MDDQECVFCSKTMHLTDDVVTLRQKGCNGINAASKKRGDVSVVVKPGDRVHKECRRLYCHPTEIVSYPESQAKSSSIRENNTKSRLRSAVPEFQFGKDCYLCGEAVSRDDIQSDCAYPVCIIEMKEKIATICEARGDDWADQVSRRISHISDLPAVDALYHQQCSVNFRTGRHIPKRFVNGPSETKRRRSGRPVNQEQEIAFQCVCDFIEDNDDEQVTVHDLIFKMAEFLGFPDSDAEPYGHTHMKMRLEENFKQEIVITEINGKPNVVTFRSTADHVLQKFHSLKSIDAEQEKFNIIKTAAKLIRDDIKKVNFSKDNYPDTDSMSSVEQGLRFLPESLQLFLHGVFKRKDDSKLVSSIGQAVMQATRPRVLLAPLQVGLAVQLHHHYASRFLIDTLYQHGFCVSYPEVQRYEQNATQFIGTEISGLTDNTVVQYVADNVDHNIRTLDGKGTFHGMGLIATVCPAVKINYTIPRGTVSPNEVSASGSIPILHNKTSLERLSVKFEELKTQFVEDPTSDADLLWKLSLSLKCSRPCWSGFMQKMQEGSHSGQASVKLLPMIDMSPSDFSCVYSTLCYVLQHSKAHGLPAVLTFDQPLWLKAFRIIQAAPENSDLKRCILRLGGFHTQMNFLGCIGHLMDGSGLREVFEEIYAPNAVDHIMTGKATSRAIRGHFIVDSVLNTLMLSDIIGSKPASMSDETDLDSTQLSTEENMLQRFAPKCKEILTKLLSKEIPLSDLPQLNIGLSAIRTALEEKKENLRKHRTPKLWIQYMDMVDLLRLFIKAERTGNWQLHLSTLRKMLPYIAASGHNLYTTSVYLYLQTMESLEAENPTVYAQFMNGFHSVRRSNRYWSGLSTDLIIEQVLMRSLKTSGGLTRGRGMTEQQRLTWLLSMPACTDVSHSMQEFTRVTYSTNDQNKEVGETRQAIDMKHTEMVESVLALRNPFTWKDGLFNIMDGVAACESVDVDTAEVIGQKIIGIMRGCNVDDFKFTRKFQAKPIAFKSAITIEGDKVQVDPQLLFQRLFLATPGLEDRAEIFKYELTSYPTSLFDRSLMLLEAHKPQLADSIWSLLPDELTHPPFSTPANCAFIIDGGALLHRIAWPTDSTYEEICSIYCAYVRSKYGTSTIVFDGYESLSTKDMTHQRRSSGISMGVVNFEPSMRAKVKKTQFLSNSTNKQKFVHLLADKLSESGNKVIKADGDADLLIVQTAVASSQMHHTVLVGDDTDLLILLLYYCPVNQAHQLLFRPEPKASIKKYRSWDINRTQTILSSHVCQNIMFLHAFLGCDTTSRLFGIGKGVSLKKFINDANFRKYAEVFNEDDALQREIIEAGEKCLCLLYNGDCNTNLNELRYHIFCKKIGSGTAHVEPRQLPPTSDAAQYHSLRVFCQIMHWKGISDIGIQEWGWTIADSRVIPKMMNMPPAPEHLLKLIRCNCSKDCRTKRCTCKKNGLKCSVICGNCRGSACTNSVSPIDSDDEDSN